ncbi:hypothetical protein [Thermosulfurimonas sp. F29]|uniref:hypothetical protein n=1 Tax=Thermosulfurimonas sp. F29 TaxID=2867247 RepID=UPI001C82AA5A|nr:hypothetical protein [Thermosulfurimonas sp. F29]MBX6423049.1 hypothetical protein [Thermosulfurimonas sp. F29]
MIDRKLLEILETLPPEWREAFLRFAELVDREIGERVTRRDFQEFDRRFEAFAERTQENFNRIWKILNETAEQRKRFEKELDQKFKKVWETIDRLSERLDRMAEQQKQFEKETKENFRRVWETLDRMAKRQERFEKETKENFRRVWETLDRMAKRQERFEKETKENFRRVWEALDRMAERQEKFEKETEENFRRVWEAIERLTERVDRLTERVDRLTEQVERIARGLERTREELGGLSRTVAYALENEAYRHLPSFLRRVHGIETVERLIRTYIDGEEVDLFGKVRRNGKEMFLVGEAVLKLDDREKLRSIWRKVEAVKEEFGGEVLPVIVTHIAHPEVLERARKAGILVVQSFEWIP